MSLKSPGSSLEGPGGLHLRGVSLGDLAKPEQVTHGQNDEELTLDPAGLERLPYAQ